MTGPPYPQNRWDLAPEPARAPTVSVVIVYYQQRADLDRLLAALRIQRGPCRIVDVTVVDDGSDPPLRLDATVGDVEVTVLHQEDMGVRPAAARNLGAQRATGEVLVFFDADTLPAPEAVAQLARLPAVVPDSMVVGRRHHVDLDGWTAADVVTWLTGRDPRPPHAFEDPAWLREGYEHTRNLLDIDDRSYQWIIGAVMATSRSFFDELGGFDASIDTYGGEDWEIAYRAFAAGALLRHEPGALAFHNGPAWAERNDWRGLKNSERLVIRRTVPGLRDPIRGPYSPHLVTLNVSNWSTDEVVATVGSVLGDSGASLVTVAIPGAPAPVVAIMRHDGRVATHHHDHESRRRALTETVVWEPVRIPSVLRLTAMVAPGGPGRVTVEHDGRRLATITSLRALARVRRWIDGRNEDDEDRGLESLFGHRRIDAAAAGFELVERPISLDVVFPR